MNAFQADELQDVWGRIQQWPEELRVSLASKILSSVHHESAPARKPFTDLIGVLAGYGPPPSEEEVRQILEEERTRKFA
jgi:hypothetical protein